MVTGLAGEGVQVLLLGTATHSGPTLTSLPAAAASLSALRQRLLDRCGVRAERLRMVIDPPDGLAMATAVADAARRADDVLFIYFIGHGLLGPGGELFLAASGTDRLTPGLAMHQALAVSAIRDAVTACRASSVVVVLDCCFAGRAVAGRGRRPESQFMLPAAQGIYFLGAAGDLAVATGDDGYTAFTGAWIRVLDRGDPLGPPVLAMDSVYDYLFRTLRAEGHPLPQRQAGDRSGDLVLATNAAQPVPDDPDAAEPAAIRCPYPGLDAFTVEAADVFCGRDSLVGQLLSGTEGAITQRLPMLVVGASGTGKTSLLHAGLLARLGMGAPGLPGSAGWPWLVVTPGERPLDELAARLWPDQADGAARLRDDPAAAGELLEHALAGYPGRRLVLVVDQLEQLFTLCSDPSERRAYLRVLAALASQPDGSAQALVVLALRADFYAVATGYAELAGALRRTQFLVEPMTRDQLRTAIEQPAATVGLALDDGLSDLILHELGATEFTNPHPGILPLLSHALWATWQRRTGVRLTAAGYRATGGIARAIAATADDTYARLDSAGRTAARWLLPRLVRIGDDGGADTARPASRVSLVQGAPDPVAADAVVHRFAEARLLTLDTDTVRLSHEALLHAWPLLKGWIDADRDWLRTIDQLTADATRWQRDGRDPSLLYRGSRLAAVQDRRASSGGTNELAAPVVEFLDAAHRQQRRARQVRQAAVAVLVVLLLLAVTGGLTALRFQQEAAEQRDIAISRQLAAQSESLATRDPVRSRVLAAAAWRIHPTPEARASMSAALLNPAGAVLAGHTDSVRSVQFSPDGGRVATASDDGTARIWDPDTGEQLVELAGHTRVAWKVRFSPDGTRLATASLDGTARIWDPDTGAELAVLAGEESSESERDVFGPTLPVNWVEFSPDGTRLATASGSSAYVWDSATGERLTEITGHPGALWSARFSPDGSKLATSGEDSTVRIWQAADGAPWTELTGHTAGISSMAFSPDGTRLATVGDDETARVWDVDTGEQVAELAGHVDPLLVVDYNDLANHVAFSPDGAVIAVGEGDGTARIWQADTGELINELPAQATDDVWSVNFTPDGSRLVTAGRDDTAQVWDPYTGELIASFAGHSHWVWSAALSPDGTRLATASIDGTARTWRLASANLAAELTGHTDAINSVAFSPDGDQVATASDDGWTRVWNADTGEPVTDIVSYARPVESAVFSPDGALVAATNQGTGLWEPTTSKRITPLKLDEFGRPAYADNVTFSPDGTRLADRGGDTAQVWDPDTGELIAELKGHTDTIRAVGFSPDSTRLATASVDGTARVWQTATGDLLAEFTTGHTDFGAPVVFSPDGSRLATTAENDSEDSARVWDVDTGELLAEVTGPDTVEHLVFSPDSTRLATYHADHSALVWATDDGAQVGGFADPATGEYTTIHSMAFRPGGTRLAIASDDGTAQVWDSVSGELVSELVGHTDAVNTAHFSPGGDRIVTASDDGRARIWDADTGELDSEAVGYADEVGSVVFSPDGTQITTRSGIGKSKVWETSNGALALELAGWDAVVSPDGRWLATSELESVRVWNASSGKEITEIAGHTDTVHAMAFSPDGTRLATGSSDMTARIWDVKTGEPLAGTNELAGHTDAVRLVVFSPDGTRLVTGSGDGTARIWDANTGEPIGELGGHARVVEIAVFSPDGTHLVTGSGGVARVWDADTGEQVAELTGHTGGVRAVAVSPDGMWLATAGADGTAQIWDTAGFEPVARLSRHTSSVEDLAFSPDSTRLATAGGDGRANIWDVTFTADPYAALCASMGHPPSPEDWSRYVPDVPYREICT